MTVLDLIIVLAFITYSISSGLYNRKSASKNLNEFFLAGQTVKGWKAGFSMAATQFAADTPLLVTGLVATAGIFAVWRLWVYALAFLMMGFLLSASWRRAKIITDAELTQTRYSGKGVVAVRSIKAFYYGTIINCTILAMVLVAAIRIAEVFCLWHQWLPASIYDPIYNFIVATGADLSAPQGVLAPAIATTNNIITIALIAIFTTTYSATGGLRAVIATDVMQFILAMIGTLLFAILAVIAAGGFGNMVDKIVELYGHARASKMLSFTPQLTKDAVIPFLVIMSLQWFYQMNSDGTGYLAQRSMGCKTDRDARIAAIVFTFGQIVVRSLFWLPICVALLVLYPITPGSETTEGFVAMREMLFATGAKDILPTGILGLMLTGMLAALASTLDTHMNWGGSYWSNDLYKELINKQLLKRKPKHRELVWVARLSNVLILIIAFIIMTQLDSIQEGWHLSLLFGAGMGAVLVLRWLWERINLFSEISSMVASIVVAPILLTYFDDEWQRLGLMALTTTIVMVVTTLLTRPVDKEKLGKFYKRVQPAGFWSKTARNMNMDPRYPKRKFIYGVGHVIFAGLTVFSSLVGFGKLMFIMPGESKLWIILAFLLAGVGIYGWWFISRKEKRDLARHEDELLLSDTETEFEEDADSGGQNYNSKRGLDSVTA